MPPPPIVLGFILATMIGAAFHFIFGGDARRFAALLMAGWLGFTLGQIFGGMFGIRIFSIGQVNTGSGSFGALIALIITHLLTRVPRRARDIDE